MDFHPHVALNYTKCWDPLALWLYVASQLQMLPCQEGWLVLQPFNRKPCVTWLKSFACYLFWLGDFQLLCVRNMEAQRRKKEKKKKKRWQLIPTPAFVNYDMFKLIPGDLSRAACVPFHSIRPPCQLLPLDSRFLSNSSMSPRWNIHAPG